MASKSIENIINELKEMGYSERKVLNRLKDIRDEMIGEKDCGADDNKEYNKLINGLLFGGRFDITYPSMPLIGLVKQVKKTRGSEFTYFLLSGILLKGWFFNGLYDRNDIEKSNLLMYHIKDKMQTFAEDYRKSMAPIKEPF
ncbi:MAG: hypothetical protein ACRCZ0_11910 [Cetobacterium sp.]